MKGESTIKIMERRMRKIIDQLTGAGILKKDEKHIADVVYNLTIFQEYLITDEDEKIETTKEITGYFNVIVGDVGNELFDTFVLEFRDGRALGVNATRQDFRSKKFNISVNDASKFQ